MINHICSNCMAKMEAHPELNNWRKCSCCGYSVEIPRKFMIKREEIVKSSEQLNEEQEKNLVILLEKLNKLRDVYGLPLLVTSGFRSLDKHKAIYSEINKKRKDQGLEALSVPMGSAHLSCEAVDFSDPTGKLKDWINNNLDIFEKLELYMEDFQYTKTWVHIQIRKPKSGNRFFKP